MPESPRIIVLDDDPTGSQTVHSCLLLTRWDEQSLRTALSDASPIFFVLTNTRAMSPEMASSVTTEVCRNLKAVLPESETSWLLVSRSDSTLRGHYPIETDVMTAELGPFDAHFLVPAFFEGGRITRGGMHYVIQDGVAVPAHETVFSKDAVFGYSSAFLPDYVEEKTLGRIPSADVVLLDACDPLDDLREQLKGLSGNVCCAVSAETQTEMDTFARAALEAIRDGKRFLFRSGASLLTSLSDLPDQPVPAEDMSQYVKHGRPGIVLVGSHVPLSTMQLEYLRSTRSVASVEIDVDNLPGSAGVIERRTVAAVQKSHAAGRTIVISTSRKERRFATDREQLSFGADLSALLMRVVQAAPRSLGFIVSKGGITSNDLLSTGLGLRTSRVVGQIHPGCSVVLTPAVHRFGSIPIVIFPGNVGNEMSLATVYDRLLGRDG